MHRRFGIAVLLAALTAAPALAAQTTPIVIEQGKDWKHKETGIEFPAKAAEFDRGEAFDFGKTGSDIAIQYREKSNGTLATVYYFRAGLPDVSIWAERVEATVLGREDYYGSFDKAGRRWARFTPATGGENSAIRFAYPLRSKGSSATGAAFAQRGDWLIGVRMTSETLTAEQIESRLAALLAGLPLKPAAELPGPAYAIQPCVSNLTLKAAKPADGGKDNLVFGSALMNSIIPDVAESKGSAPSKPMVFCRDGASVPNGAVYRPDGSNDSYVLAFGDGGVVVTAAPDPASVLLGEGKPQLALTLITNDRLVGYRPFKSLPTPDQAMQMLDKGPATYARSRLPGDKNVELFMPKN